MNFNFVQANVNRILNVIQNLHSTILNNLVANEEPSTIESEKLSLQVEKKTARALGGTTNKLKDCSFKLPSGDAFGLTESMLTWNTMVCLMIRWINDYLTLSYTIWWYILPYIGCMFYMCHVHCPAVLRILVSKWREL